MIPIAFVLLPILFAREVFADDEEKSAKLDSEVAGYLSDENTHSLPSQLTDSSFSDESCVNIAESLVDEASLAQLCHLLGPIVPKDEDEELSIIAEDKLPPNLEFSANIDLPVGYFRLRRAFLSKESKFWTESILKVALGYTEVKGTGWQHPHEDHIGYCDLPSNVNHQDFIGASKHISYLMPAGRLVPANTAYETCSLTEYNDDFFTLCMTTKTPGVPFGERFIAKTQITVVRTGKNSCRMLCSVEAEFPNGNPLGMKGQIKKGMKRGTIDMFNKIGIHIINCATSYGWC